MPLGTTTSVLKAFRQPVHVLVLALAPALVRAPVPVLAPAPALAAALASLLLLPPRTKTPLIISAVGGHRKMTSLPL